MLIGSTIHDFAFKHGYLLVSSNQPPEKIPIERHIADALLRDLIATRTYAKHRLSKFGRFPAQAVFHRWTH